MVLKSPPVGELFFTRLCPYKGHKQTLTTQKGA
nr:MAG TPA: hypothetical protein [Caudoviricetes sp.]